MITIVWTSTSTITAEVGGDTLEMLFRTLSIDATENERHSARADVTTHAVERGADIADHVRPSLRELSLDCAITSDPGEARETLETLRTSRQLLTVITQTQTYDNMILSLITEQRSHETGDALYVTLEFAEVKIVDSEEVEAPAPRVERGRRRRAKGAQPTETSIQEGKAPGKGAGTRSQSLQDASTAWRIRHL